MTTATASRPAPRAPIEPSRYARGVVDLGAGALLVAAVSAATCWLLDVPTSHLGASEALYAVLGIILLRRVPDAARLGVGAANRVTLARAALVLPVFALALRPPHPGPTAAWWVRGLSAAAMSLDFVDGRVARATGSSTRFGARFDMETDALLLLALSMLLRSGGKVGAWVILIGALRYLFVFAGLLWPLLNGALPPSLRRKTVCVWQGVTLVVALAPVTPGRAASALAAAALALLVYSFGVDVWWLLAHGPAAPTLGGEPAERVEAA
jgi:phosphatidylglycerophosphate synthase